MTDLEKVQKTLSDVFDYLNRNDDKEVGKRLLTEVGDAHRIVENLAIHSVVGQSEQLCDHKWKDFGYGNVDCCEKCKDWKWGE